MDETIIHPTKECIPTLSGTYAADMCRRMLGPDCIHHLDFMHPHLMSLRSLPMHIDLQPGMDDL